MGFDFTGLGSAFDFGKSILDKIWPPQADPTKKLEAQTLVTTMIQERDKERDKVKKDVLVAELQQSDNYTKRARPSVIYVGLIFIGLNCVIFPFIMKCLYAVLIFGVESITIDQINQLKNISSFELPGHFWLAWGGICSTWVIGRSVEKRGKSENAIVNKVVSMITGNQK